MSQRLFYRTYGKGLPILILHGFLGNSDQWIETGKFLSPNFQVLIPDLPNHGNSFHSKSLSLKEAAHILLDFLAELKPEKVILLGHSWGGKISMTMASEKPEWFSKLIFVDISPRAYPFHERWDFRMSVFEKICHQKFSSFKELESFLKNFHLDLWEQALFFKNFIRKDNVLACKCNAEVLIRDFSEIFKEVPLHNPITIPTLFIKGELSNYISQEDEQSLPTKFSFSDIIKIKGANHCPHLENPKEFLNALRKFIEFS